MPVITLERSKGHIRVGLRLTPRHFCPSCGPALVLSYRPKGSANEEGKELVKFVDGLTSVAGECTPAAGAYSVLVDARDLRSGSI